MTDQELLNEIEREFGSHAPAKNDCDDLDAFIADLKKTIASDTPPVQHSSQSVPDSIPPKKEKHSARASKKDTPPKQKPVKARTSAAPVPGQDVPSQKEPRGLTRFIIRHHVGINISLLCLCLVLAAGIAAVFFYEGSGSRLGNKIMENVYVAGVDVGGMTREEALDAVVEAIGNHYTEGIMKVHLGRNTLTIAPSQARPVLQITGAIEEAYAYGRTGSASERKQAFRDIQYTPKHISLEPYLSLNTDYIRSAVTGFVDSFSGEYSPSGYSLDGEMPALNAEDFDSSTPCQTLILQVGNPGGSFDLDGICSAILSGYYMNQFEVQIPSEVLPEFPEELDLDAIYQQLHVEAMEAVQDPATGEIIPGSCGYTFSLTNARTELDAASYGETIFIPMEYVMPQRLEFNGSYVETLSSYITSVNGNDAYYQNLKLLCKKLDGLVLEPGQVFSFNTALPRTQAEGFQKAFRHGSKCGDEEIGGGADQVATTLYVAAMTAGLSVTQKNVADHLCDYTTKGTEITVSANWQDLKLTNPLTIPVKIRAKVMSQQVRIQILSESPLDFYVKLETQEGYTSPHGTLFVYKAAADGYTNGQILTEGADGGQVTLQWIKYDKATDRELSKITETVQVPALHTIIANVSG